MTFKTIDEIENGMYCHPINKNFESVDAVIAPNIFFQITVAEKHPILQAGFRQLLEKFQISQDNKAQLYFIVPDYLFNNFRKQPYVYNQKKKMNHGVKITFVDLRIYMQDLTTTGRFIYIDDEVPLQELTDEEIIRAVKPNLEVNNSDEEEEAEMVHSS
ncbi:9830_t:CDS:2 [Entrophospora sp. SA101]|nr:9830_t:CDS:2 [Entrophospora sp. SA101]